jgi:hypothetical protein
VTADDEIPPWHAYCGCHGCRTGNAIARKILAAPWAPRPRQQEET